MIKVSFVSEERLILPLPLIKNVLRYIQLFLPCCSNHPYRFLRDLIKKIVIYRNAVILQMSLTYENKPQCYGVL